jgi:hypothetical protein
MLLVTAVADCSIGDLWVGRDDAWNAGDERHAGDVGPAGGHLGFPNRIAGAGGW